MSEKQSVEVSMFAMYVMLTLENNNIEVSNLEDSAYLNFAYIDEQVGFRVFAELNAPTLKLPVIDIDPYIPHIMQTVTELDHVSINQEVLNDLMIQINDSILQKEDPEFFARMQSMKTILVGAVQTVKANVTNFLGN